MAILRGSLTVRRFRVAGSVPEGFREAYQEALQSYAFRESHDAGRMEENAGWVEIHNLLDTTFADINRWLYDRYLVFALRVDKKTLPSKLFRAHLEKREAAWCAEHDRPRCPAAVRKELKEQLQLEMLGRTLPRVSVHEVCWNVVDDRLLFHNLSDSVNDRFRKLFFQTFGLKLFPEEPLDLLGADGLDEAELLLRTGGLDYRPEART
jgi:DNA recombination-dependent growth factor C